MILFEKLRWKNILSTGNTFTEIQLNKHKTCLIVGENGAGKSTILDALCFVLYGKPFRKINKGQLLNSINNKALLVEIEFKIGKRNYLIKRGIKPNVFEIYVNNTLLDQHADAKQYQEMLEKHILKLNYKSFSQVVILGSASFVPFMQLTAANRREVIEDLLDIQIFSTMHVLLKDKISSNRIELGDVDSDIKVTAEKIELYKKHIDLLKQNNEELIAQKQKKKQELQQNINAANEQITQLSTSAEKAAESIQDQDKVKNKINKIVDISRQIDVKLTKIQKDILFFEQNDDCPTCRQGISHDHKQGIVATNNDQVQTINDGKIQMEKELQSLNVRLQEIQEVNDEITKHNREISNLNIQVQTWNNFVTDINKEIQDLQSNTKQIDDNEAESDSLKQSLRDALKKREELKQQKDVMDIASTLLKDGGIRTKIIKQYVPVINKLINKYLAAMDFFVNFELNENFEEVIKSRFRDEFSYDSFSEGEKLRIDLALLFAWRAVGKLRNSASTNLLIMDEIFDSSLDGTGTDEFMKIINGLAGDTNTFIISHKGDQLYEKFNHVVKFEKHKNFSRISS
jgi:DNA repair exonuclease SbcCD ATPase subunit